MFDAFVFYVIALFCACLGVRRLAPIPRTSPTCSRCDYDLAGLSAGAPCPECGTPEPGVRLTPEQTELALTRSRQPSIIVASVLIFILFAYLAEPLAVELLVDSYVRDGFLASSARNAIRLRELARTSPAAILFPLASAVVAFPLAARIRDRATAWKVALAVLLAGIFVQFFVWRV
jgi:hypothetical protein